MEYVLTIAGALDDAIVARAEAALNRLHGQPGPRDWLAPGAAVDIPFTGITAIDAAAAVRAALSPLPLDFCAQPAQGRRKRLLVADMDSTIVTSETLDELAARAGLKDKVAPITERAMRGEIDFAGALRQRVGLLAGLPEQALADTMARIALTGGALSLVRTMTANGAHAALASGGFDYFTSRVARTAGFHEHRANRLQIAGGKLTGRVIEPILDRDAKLALLCGLAENLGLAPADAAAVGDGANDLGMLTAAGLGCAFHAKPMVSAEAPARIDFGDLGVLLYYQGYRRSEWR